MNSTTELPLWERASHGDADAFGAVFDLHYDRILLQARRLTESLHDAEDVTALVFLEAWRKRESVRVVDGSVFPWLAVTTTNVARNSVRSRNRHRALLTRLHDPGRSGLVTPDHADEVAERLDRQAAVDVAYRALAALPRRDREVIALCLIQGLTAVQAAAALEVAPGTVKSRLSRARARLGADVLAALSPASPRTTGGAR